MTREKIKAYACSGGTWKHLEKELVNEGFTVLFAKKFVENFNRGLGYANSETALSVYDQWLSSDEKGHIELILTLKYFNDI